MDKPEEFSEEQQCVLCPPDLDPHPFADHLKKKGETTVKYEVWVERGGHAPTRSPMYLPMEDKAQAFLAKAECERRSHRFLRPEAANYRYWVVEVTTTRREITS